MTTTNELCNVLADALGIGRILVKAHARALCEAGLSPGGDADQVDPEDAAVLLITLMVDESPDKSSDAARLYADLPLDCAHSGGNTAGGGQVPDAGIPATAATFGALLATLICWFNEASETDFEVTGLTLGGGLGTVQAIVNYGFFTDRGEVPCELKFTLVPLGAGYLPDDAPSARIDRYSFVPGVIFSALREAFTGKASGPERILISYTDSGFASDEAHA